jgi:hypothetical protein
MSHLTRQRTVVVVGAPSGRPLRTEQALGARGGQNVTVKLRMGTIVAFGVGYTLGARAGRERYVQIVRLAGQVGHSSPVAATIGAVGDKARAVVVLGVERTRDVIGIRLGLRDGDEAADVLAQDLAAALNGRGRT